VIDDEAVQGWIDHAAELTVQKVNREAEAAAAVRARADLYVQLDGSGMKQTEISRRIKVAVAERGLDPATRGLGISHDQVRKVIENSRHSSP
jgi:hypothetical protein